MATITEDYVSFETAKLLKEKGFDEPLQCFYKFDSKELYRGTVFTNTQIGDKFYNAPTLQMAMKWLREVHNIFIDIRFNRTYQRYKYFVFFMCTNDDYMYDHTNLSKKESYEETVESALRYCLEHLI